MEGVWARYKISTLIKWALESGLIRSLNYLSGLLRVFKEFSHSLFFG